MLIFLLLRDNLPSINCKWITCRFGNCFTEEQDSPCYPASTLHDIVSNIPKVLHASSVDVADGQFVEVFERYKLACYNLGVLLSFARKLCAN